MYALIDCNNFYASCERLFRPDLRLSPIVVLSNNDGCVIARSNEAKELKIPMGAPYFKIKAFCQQHHVHVFSSNYALYGDMSHRVMRVIDAYWPVIEVYSIDEAFLDLSTLPAHLHDSFCETLQAWVLKSTGIPTSIGIGQTKTLAKIANHVCKKELRVPVFNVAHQRNWLKQISIEDVWGVGRQWSKKLRSLGVHTASDLAQMDLERLTSQLNVVLMRTAMELQGTPCSTFQDNSPSQSIVSSRSFGEMQTEWFPLAQAVSGHVARAYEKLRHQHLLVSRLTVFIQTNPFERDAPQYNNQMQFKLIHPTDDIRLLTRIARKNLKKIYRPGFHYKKVGVCFEGLTQHRCRQLDLFHQHSEEDLQKTAGLMDVLDRINQKFGRHTIQLAAVGFDKPWAMRANMQSPRYTTQWSDLPTIKNGT